MNFTTTNIYINYVNGQQLSIRKKYKLSTEGINLNSLLSKNIFFCLNNSLSWFTNLKNKYWIAIGKHWFVIENGLAFYITILTFLWNHIDFLFENVDLLLTNIDCLLKNTFLSKTCVPLNLHKQG